MKTSPKRLYSVIGNERFGLVFAKTVSIISGTGWNTSFCLRVFSPDQERKIPKIPEVFPGSKSLIIDITGFPAGISHLTVYSPRSKARSYWHTDKKENQNFPIYKEIQNGAVAKSYITNGLLIYGEIFPNFLIYWEAFPHIWLCNCSTLNFLI